jgi:hypothetical protein
MPVTAATIISSRFLSTAGVSERLRKLTISHVWTGVVRTATLPLEHNFNSSSANAERLHSPSSIISFCLLVDRSSFSAQSADLYTLSNAGLTVLLEEAWYTLPSPSIHHSPSTAPQPTTSLHSILCFNTFCVFVL